MFPVLLAYLAGIGMIYLTPRDGDGKATATERECRAAGVLVAAHVLGVCERA